MTLFFNNPVFSEGINCTVRRGIKWAAYDSDYISICDTKGDYIGCVKIIDVVVIKFYDIIHNTGLIELEHDPKCRDYHELKSEMEKCYNNFKVDEIVTILYFKLI